MTLLLEMAQGRGVWLVGGAVRDRFLNRESPDLDLVVQGEARELARRVADALGAFYYDLDRERDTGRVIITDEKKKRGTLDFARLREEHIHADLVQRDFTVNAMAVDLSEPGEILDPLGGMQDLKDERLRACSPHAIADDPVRALRAVRIAAELGLRIESDTLHQIVKAKSRLDRVAPERVRDEFMRLLDHAHPVGSVRVLDHLGLLEYVCPELDELKGLSYPNWEIQDVWEYTLAVVESLANLIQVLGPVPDPDTSADLMMGHASLLLGRFRRQLHAHLNATVSADRRVHQLVFFASLYHVAGLAPSAVRPHSRTVSDHRILGDELVARRAQSLRLSNAEICRLCAIVKHQLDPDVIKAIDLSSPRGVYRFFRVAGDAGVDIVLLYLASLLAIHRPHPEQEAWSISVESARGLLEAYFEDRDKRISPPRIIKGDELAATLGIPPGPEVGRLLEIIREAQAAGEVETPEQALALASQTLSGENPV